jgi:hypothetical protein
VGPSHEIRTPRRRQAQQLRDHGRRQRRSEPVDDVDRLSGSVAQQLRHRVLDRGLHLRERTWCECQADHIAQPVVLRRVEVDEAAQDRCLGVRGRWADLQLASREDLRRAQHLGHQRMGRHCPCPEALVPPHGTRPLRMLGTAL